MLTQLHVLDLPVFVLTVEPGIIEIEPAPTSRIYFFCILNVVVRPLDEMLYTHGKEKLLT